MKRALQMIDQAVVNWDLEVPRVIRCGLTLPIFISMCTIVKAAVAYYEYLKGKYHAVWESVPQMERCFARMCIHGDSSVTDTFQAGYDLCNGHVSRLDIVATAPDSDWAAAVRSLQTRLEELTPPATVAPLAAPVDPTATAAEDTTGHGVQQASMAAVPTPVDHRERHRDLIMTAKLSEAHLALEATIALFVGAPREPAQAWLGNCFLGSKYGQ